MLLFSVKFGRAAGSRYSFQFLTQKHGPLFAKQWYIPKVKKLFSQEEVDPGLNRDVVLFTSLIVSTFHNLKFFLHC